MSTVAFTRLIEAPAEEVWRIFTDVAARPGWLCSVTEVELRTSGGFGPGAVWRETRVLPDGTTSTEEFAVEEATPPFRLTVVSAGIGVDYRTTYTFTPVLPRRRRPDRTAVTVIQEGTPTARYGRWVALVLGGLGTRAMESALRRDLADLAVAVRRAAGTAGSVAA